MIKGIYTAASGMMLQMSRQDAVANNIANVNTVGYKKDTTISQSFPNMLISRLGDKRPGIDGTLQVQAPVPIGYLGTGAVVAGMARDTSVGNLKATQNPEDLAISGQGYFAIDTPEGERFTRNGSFTINNEGLLVTNQGYALLDTNDEPIEIKGEFAVDKQGSISVNGEFLTTLKLVNFEDQQLLVKEGDLLNSSGQAYMIAADPGILQGHQELSNVNAVKEMVTLISTTRAYESCQKVVQAEDETLGMAINQVGSVV